MKRIRFIRFPRTHFCMNGGSTTYITAEWPDNPVQLTPGPPMCIFSVAYFNENSTFPKPSS